MFDNVPDSPGLREEVATTRARVRRLVLRGLVPGIFLFAVAFVVAHLVAR